MKRQVRTSLCHWGAFSATIEEGRLIETVPFDGTNAGPAKIGALPKLVYSDLRIGAPMVRESFLAKRESSDPSLHGHGVRFGSEADVSDTREIIPLRGA